MGDALVAGFEFMLLASVYCLVTLPRARNQYSVHGSEHHAWRLLKVAIRRMAHRDEHWLTARELDARRRCHDRRPDSRARTKRRYLRANGVTLATSSSSVLPGKLLGIRDNPGTPTPCRGDPPNHGAGVQRRNAVVASYSLRP
jgi:hypothetical protein